MLGLLLIIVYFSFTNAAFIELFNFTIQPGNIFNRYGHWLNAKYDRWEKAHDPTRDVFWLKAAGLCKYCFQVWVSLLTIPLLIAALHYFDLPRHWLVCVVACIGYVSLSHLLLYMFGE